MTGMKSALFVVGVLASIMSCYAVSLRASGERLAMISTSSQITRDLTEMRLLRAELRTRSRLPELQRWNEQVLALAAPRAEQLVRNPVLLAGYAVHSSVSPGAVVVAVIRNAPASVAPILHQASFVPQRAHDLVADAALASLKFDQMPTGFQKIALR